MDGWMNEWINDINEGTASFVRVQPIAENQCYSSAYSFWDRRCSSVVESLPRMARLWLWFSEHKQIYQLQLFWNGCKGLCFPGKGCCFCVVGLRVWWGNGQVGRIPRMRTLALCWFFGAHFCLTKKLILKVQRLRFPVMTPRLDPKPPNFCLAFTPLQICLQTEPAAYHTETELYFQ